METFADYLVITFGTEPSSAPVRIALETLSACVAAHRAIHQFGVGSTEGVRGREVREIARLTLDARYAAARLASAELTALGFTGERGAEVLARVEV